MKSKSPFILVDTSVWIDLLNKRAALSLPLEKLPLLATSPPIVQEVLQGIRQENAHQKVYQGLISLNMMMDPVPLEIYIQASEIFRLGRKRGLTIRSSIDCVIAAIASTERLTLWHKDRDFSTIARFVNLETITSL